MEFNILYQDEYLIAIDKPPGILVHKTELSMDRVYVLQELRNQIQQHLYPVHRLDRPTSGVLIFALSSEVAAWLSQQFRNHQVDKQYLALVRGWILEDTLIQKPLEGKEASTLIQALHNIELPIPQRSFESSRFSLIQAMPQTGRFHQIRLHLRHLRHPIIGDTTHGDGLQNQIFREHLGIHRLLLHCSQMQIQHPSGHHLSISASPPRELQQFLPSDSNKI